MAEKSVWFLSFTLGGFFFFFDHQVRGVWVLNLPFFFFFTLGDLLLLLFFSFPFHAGSGLVFFIPFFFFTRFGFLVFIFIFIFFFTGFGEFRFPVFLLLCFLFFVFFSPTGFGEFGQWGLKEKKKKEVKIAPSYRYGAYKQLKILSDDKLGLVWSFLSFFFFHQVWVFGFYFYFYFLFHWVQ